MKAENAVGLIGLVAIAGLVAWYAARYDALMVSTQEVANVSAVESHNQNANTPLGLSVVAVAEHASPADCWIIVSSKVYDVTTYLARHPGGAFRITPYCGKDATVAFQTQGGEGTHSSVATQDLLALYVGEVSSVEASAVPPVSAAPNVNTTLATAPVNTSTSSNVVLTTSTVAAHSRSADCWIIVSGAVYNVTSYLAKHPGGASRIIPYCGKDATSAFSTRGGTGTHSSNATADLAALRLGILGSTTTSKIITQSNANASTLIVEEDDDDEREEEDDDE